MAQYAIAFDLDNVAMAACGLSKAEVTNIYSTEIPNALNRIGFTAHPQGSLYHTELEQEPMKAIIQLQAALKQNAPRFCEFVRAVHVFRMEEWSEITDVLSLPRRPKVDIPPDQILTLADEFFVFSGRTH